jgi:transcriptional regulator with XRE-family HTH domain
MNFGQHLRSLRTARGVSQRSLADQVDIDFSYISKIEQGHMKPPSEDVIRKIARALDVSEDELMNLAGKVPGNLKAVLHNNPLLSELLRVLSERPLSEEIYQEMLTLAQETEG